MPTTFIKANRKYKQANGEYSDPISYSTSSESVEMTDGTDLQTKIGTMDTVIGNKVDKVSGKGLSTNDYDNTAKGKVDALGTASTKDVPTSGNASATQVVMGNDSRLTDSRPASDVSAWAKESTKPTYTASEVGAIATTAKGSNNGVAELDANGKVPSAQLPSYVDDVIEGYYNSSTDRFYKESTFTTVIPPESGKSWVDIPSNKSYRWTGSVYTRVDEGVQLGETSSTAYRGDRGKIAYDHSQLTSGNPHNVSKSDVGLGNVGNFKAVSTEASQGLTDTEKSNARTNIGAGTSNFSGSYNDLSDKPDLDAKLDKAGGTMTGSIVTTTGTAMKPQTNNTGNVGSSGYRYAAGYYNFVDLKGSNTNGSFAAVLHGAEDTGTIEFAKEADSNNDYRQVFQNKDGTLALTSDIEVSEEDIASTQTVSGNVVTVTDAAPINAEDITVDITPKQDLHGYDRPWAGGAGKNKLPMTVAGIKAANTSGTWSGNNYTYNNVVFTIQTDDDGNTIGIKVNGTPSVDTYFYFGNKNFNGSYKVSGYQDSIYTRITVYVNNSIVTNIDNDDAPYSLTVTSSDSVNISIKLLATWTFTNNIVSPIVCLATETDATFAPYSNECPIEGWTGAELDRVGKNWLPNNYSSSSAAGIDYTANNDGTVLASNTATNISSFGFGGVKRIKAGSYILNGCPIDGSSSTFELQIVINGTTYRDYGNGVAFSTDHDADYSIQILIRKGYTCPIGGLLFKAMIRLASITDSTYEPYQGQQYTADFGETVFGGKWHVTDGGTDKTYKLVDLSTLSWTVSSVYKQAYLSDAKAPESDNVAANALCEKYHIVARVNTDNTGDAAIDTQKYLKIRTSESPTGYICYELETPTTISTPKQNVPMLQGINTVSADCGDTSLKYQPDNVIGELKGEIEDVIDYAEPKFVNYSSYPHDTDPETAFGVNVRLRRDRGYVSIENVALTFWQNYPIADFYYEIQSPVPTEFIPEYDVEKLFLHINGQSFLNVILTNTGILKLRMYSPVRIVDNYPNVFWLQTSDETGCGKAKY